MPTVYASSLGGPKPQFEDSAGLPATGYRLFWYVGGSVNTKQDTYTDSTGTVANANPIVLNSLGQPTTEIWLVSGLYKVVFAPPGNDDPPSSPIFAVDNIRGINDTSVVLSQWQVGPAPTFVSGSSFTLAGDQTSSFQVGRRVQITDSITTKYGTIATSSYDGVSLTTVSVTMDSGGTLVSPLASVSYGLLSATNPSVPDLIDGSGDIVVTHPSGRTLISYTPIIPGVSNVGLAASVSGNALTIALKQADGTTNATATSPARVTFRSATTASGAQDTVSATAALSLVISSGSTLGTINAVQNRLAVLALNNASTIELAVVNLSGGNTLTETGVISTTAEGGGGAADSANVIYSATARTNVAYRVLGYVESTQATAGTWATTPSTVQVAGGQAFTAMSSIAYGQTLQDLTGSRALTTTYYNTTGKPIWAWVQAYSTAGNRTIFCSINGATPVAVGMTTAINISGQGSCMIPPGASYAFTIASGVLDAWSELR